MSSELKSISGKYLNLEVVALVMALLALNFDVLQDLFHKWYAQDLEGTYSHGLLVAVIVVYLVYKKILHIRHELFPNSSLVGLVFLLGSQGMLFIAKLAGVNFIQHIMLVTSLLAIIWAVYSWQVAKQFILPAILFSLSFPVWGDAAFLLQKISVFTTNIFLSLTSLPYYHEHALFHFPNGVIEIAPECAGLQQLLVSLIIGLLFSYQHNLRLRDIVKTLIFISLTAILINTIRIIIIMFVGYFTKMESSLLTKHILLGWVIYGIGIYIFLYFYSRIKFAPATNMTVIDSKADLINLSGRRLSGLYLILLMVVLLPSILDFAITRHINNQPVRDIDYRVVSNAWQKTSEQISNELNPDYPDGDTLSTATYANKYTSVYLYISHYVHLRDVEPITMDNRAYDSDKWSIQKNEMLTISRGDGSTDIVRFEKLLSKTNRQMDVLTFYIVNGKIATRLVQAKLNTLFGMLKLKYDIKVVCLAYLGDSGRGEGKKLLIQFYKALQIYTPPE